MKGEINKVYIHRKLFLMFNGFLILLLTAAGGNMKEMTFDEFREYMANDGISEFEVTFDGNESSVTATKQSYVFVQVITYCGVDDIMSSYKSWASDEDFVLIYKNIIVPLGKSKIRTYIEKTGSFSQRETDNDKIFSSVEYGLIKNKKYYAKFCSEQYHLPPDRNSGKPRKKINHVLWISSSTYKDGKPQVELTPMYKNWSY